MDYRKRGFTIVELLVVIVVIGILAAITIVSYTGLSSKANVASLQSDLNNASKAIKLFQITNSNYPDSVSTSCSTSTATILCTKASSGTTYQYAVNNSTNPQSFYLTATKNSTTYKISSNTSPVIENSIVDGLVGRWSLDSSTGTTDLSFNGNNGIAVGNMTVGTAVNHSGVANGATAFDGVDDYVNLGTGISSTGNFTISAWVKPNINTTISGQSYPILEVGGTSPYNAFRIMDGNKFALRIDSWGGTGDILYTITNNWQSQWVHLVGIWDYSSQNAYLYVNNTLVKSESKTTTTTSLTWKTIGCYNGTWIFWPGQIGDVRIYNRVLSQTEITNLYNSN